MSQYPYEPGYRESDTSKKSAEKVKPRAKDVRTRVLEIYQRLYLATGPACGGLTPDEVAERIGRSILTVRPRVTELYKQGKIVDTGLRRKNASGHMAKVWRLAAVEPKSES